MTALSGGGERLLHLQMNEQGNELAGYHVLVVEDDYFVALDMCRALRRRGAIVVGPAANMQNGRELLRQQQPTCALLDVNLNGEFVFELATELRAQRVPTIFTTGYDTAFLPFSLRDMPCLQKPVDFNALVRLIRASGQGHSL
jgi:two-component system, response regulator PdtaR